MKRLTSLLLLAAFAGCSTEAPTTAAPSQPAATSQPAAPTQPVESSDPDTSSKPPATPSTSDEVIVIDVRSNDEWETGHVTQAIHIPHTEIADRISDVSDNKDAKIVLYCASGGRAGRAKTALESLGFTNVENGGGYDDVKDRFNEEASRGDDQ